MWTRVLTLSAAASAICAAATPAVDFQREVRPILSNACFQCHGFDQASRMASLRLDTRDGVFAERKNGRVIVPGDPQSSLLWQRVDHENAARRMPPASSHKSITAEQKATLKRWIEQGAPWTEHWAFAAPIRSDPPKANQGWVRNPIDNFVLAKLEAAGLAPAPEADRRTLARRLSFDLTGLPPDPAVVEAFLKGGSSNAYEKLADRFLSLPGWGEHRARYWLDAARYADTHGIHIDNFREMWPYRDWVIRAFNRNLRFDQFTVEQMAGDLLPERTLDQWVASGFHRCNPTTNEGGVIPEEFDAIYAKDRVDTTGTVFLGLTVGCATCHDHKFDPILQREVYQLAAFFRNTTQKTMDGNIRDTPPVIFVPPAGEEARWQDLIEQEKQLRNPSRLAMMDRFEKWLPGVKLAGASDPAKDATFVLSEKFPRAAGVEWKTGPRGRELEFFAKAKLTIPAAGGLNADQPFTISTWFYLPTNRSAQVLASRIVPKEKKKDDLDTPKDEHNGWILDLDDARIRFTLVGDSNRDRLSIRAKTNLQRAAWHHVAIAYDGSRRSDSLKLYINGERVEPAAGNDWKPLLGSLGNDLPLLLGSNGVDRDFNGGALQDFRIFTRSVTGEDAALLAQWHDFEEARRKPSADWTAAERAAAATYYRTQIDREARAQADNYEHVVADKLALQRRGGLTHVQVEKKDAPFAHILYRGMYDQPRDKVTPDVPGVLPPMAAALPRNRLGLAQWLVAPENPLLARVTVNRFWQELFGAGIVRTAEDFGSQGEAPSHPELLDWLAVEFRESGWDVKRLFKLIVTSAAYRQQALTTPDKLQKDPQNRLLSRGPRFRMDGEAVRDLALSASGLLGTKIGGPSVKPYQPSGIWETVAMDQSDTRFYDQDHGKSLYRRSLYTFWKRSAPPASMDVFNAPTRELCTVRRERTNTPLQALVVMNDPQFVEAARNLAQHAMNASRDSDQRIDYMTARVLSRPFHDSERAIIKREMKDLLQHYDTHLGDAKKLIAVGESKADARLSAPEFAAWTMVASNILNLDEALNR